MATFFIQTFGCQMNAADSQWLDDVLEQLGYQPGPMEDADVIILNTCSVREKPEQRVKDAIFRFAALSSKNPLICVAGCVAQQLGEQLFELRDNVRLVCGTDNFAAIPDAIAELLDEPEKRLALLDFSKIYLERPLGAQQQCQAFVNIMQGCDNFCSYCIVPFTRGPQKSRLLRNIVAECQSRIDSGAREITLLGQNVNAWGKDTGEASFAELLKKIAALPGLERLRFITPHPADMDEASIEAFAELPNLCPALHLPLQAGSNRILKKMRRRYTSEQYYQLLQKLKYARPDLALSTDLIVGFPGEDEADFKATLDLVKACGFVSSFSFCYSDRPGTRASVMPDKIALELKLERLRQLQELQDKLTADWLARRVGQVTELLIEKPATRGADAWQGRDPYGCAVNVRMTGNAAGKMARVKITEVKKHSLLAELL